MAVILIRELRDEYKRVHRRQQNDLPAHVTKNTYFENQGHGNPDTGYYINSKKKNHIPIEFVHTNKTDLWVEITYRENGWYTNQQGIINAPLLLGWWIESDPQHPDHINLEHFSPTLHTTVKQQQEEILAGGVHHIATLQGTHWFEEQEPILPQIEAAVKQGITIPLDIIPATATQPQLSIRTTMAEQQEEINTTIGQASQEVQRINVITNPAHSALKGNPPFIFDGEGSTTRCFMVNFDLFKAINRNNDTMKRPFNRIITMLSYMDSTKVDAWKEEQLKILMDEMNDGILETDKNLWDDFIDHFKQVYTNQNQKNEAYQALCNLKQGDSINNFFAKFKQLANEADIPLDDKGTIETLKHTLKPPLVRAIIHAPDFDPNDDIPWTFKQWEKQARLSYHKWKAASQYNQQKQGLFKAFGISPRQTSAKNHCAGGNNYG